MSELTDAVAILNEKADWYEANNDYGSLSQALRDAAAAIEEQTVSHQPASISTFPPSYPQSAVNYPVGAAGTSVPVEVDPVTGATVPAPTAVDPATGETVVPPVSPPVEPGS